MQRLAKRVQRWPHPDSASSYAYNEPLYAYVGSSHACNGMRNSFGVFLCPYAVALHASTRGEMLAASSEMLAA